MTKRAGQKTHTKTSTSAKILYRPVGMLGSVLAGLVANAVFRFVWKKARRGDRDDPPGALESEYDLREILAAAVVQGAIYAAVRTLTDRGGARAYQRVTGDWPGS